MLSQTGPGPSMGDLLTCSTSMGAFFSFFFFWHIKVQRYTDGLFGQLLPGICLFLFPGLS